MQDRRVGKWELKLPEISLGLWRNFGDTAQLELAPVHVGTTSITHAWEIHREAGLCIRGRHTVVQRC
jgi:aryl-alcohol dehydrogenase-like predicted oxidoreductase